MPLAHAAVCLLRSQWVLQFCNEREIGHTQMQTCMALQPGMAVHAADSVCVWVVPGEACAIWRCCRRDTEYTEWGTAAGLISGAILKLW